MLWFALGKWSSHSGRFFILERYYYRGKWTPIVRVSFRYLKTIKESQVRYNYPPVHVLQGFKEIIEELISKHEKEIENNDTSTEKN